MRLKNSDTRPARTISSPACGVYVPPLDRSRVVKLPMNTKMPSDEFGSASAVASVSCRKKPFCDPPVAVRASVFS